MTSEDPNLADTLKRLVPEPPRHMSAADIIMAARTAGKVGAGRRAWRRERWAPVLAATAVVLIAGIVAITQAMHGGTPVPQAGKSPGGRQPAPAVSSSAAPVALAYPRLAGAQGTVVWEVTGNGVSVSRDGGQRWADVALPAGVAASSVAAVCAAAGHGVWLAAWRGDAVGLYHRPGSAGHWIRQSLVPSLPSGLHAGGQPPHIAVHVTAGNVVTVIAGWSLGTTSAYDTLFVSTDNGARFVQHRMNIGMHVWSVTFTSPLSGLAIAGPTMNFLYRTSDGGATWAAVHLPGQSGNASHGAVPGLSYGTPDVQAADILLPVVHAAGTGAQSISIFRSDNGGYSFAAPSGAPLRIPASATAGQVVPAIAGELIWMPARDAIYESANAGATWVPVARPGPAAAFVEPVSIIDASRAVGMAAESGGGRYLVATSDGGRSWHEIRPSLPEQTGRPGGGQEGIPGKAAVVPLQATARFAEVCIARAPKERSVRSLTATTAR